MEQDIFLNKENNQGEGTRSPECRESSQDVPKPCENKPARITAVLFFGQKETE